MGNASFILRDEKVGNASFILGDEKVANASFILDDEKVARAEGLLFLHGLESNPGSSLQTEEEAGLP